MPLKIVEAWERPPVEQVVVLLYGLPATGKTTTAFSADDPLLLDFDAGADRAGNVSRSVAIGDWQDVSGITEADLEGVGTVVVDTLGAAQEVLSHDIIRRNPRHGRDGSLTLQGYGAMKARFPNWLAHLQAMGRDVVLVAHTEEDRRGDDAVAQRLAMVGGSKDYVHRAADAIGRLHLVDGRRVLDFNPTDTALGKNPGRLEPMLVPTEGNIDGFLGGVIRRIKQRMNADLTAKREARKTAVEKAEAERIDWGIRLTDSGDIGDFNALVADTLAQTELPDAEKRSRWDALKTKATQRGWVFDKASKRFETESERESREEREAIIAADAEGGTA